MVWKDILKGLPFLKQGIKVVIGDGRDTSLWYNHWVGDSPLYLHTRSNIPPSLENWKVANIISNGKWELSHISHLLPHDILIQILATPLSCLDPLKDSLTWTLSKHGDFTIKSSYFKNLGGSEFNSIHSSAQWKYLWKLHLPYKYKMLLWNLFHKILPCGDVLKYRIIHFDATCTRCHNFVETHIHLFRDCHSSTIIWAMLLDKFGYKNAVAFQQFV